MFSMYVQGQDNLPCLQEIGSFFLMPTPAVDDIYPLQQCRRNKLPVNALAVIKSISSIFQVADSSHILKVTHESPALKQTAVFPALNSTFLPAKSRKEIKPQ